MIKPARGTDQPTETRSTIPEMPVQGSKGGGENGPGGTQRDCKEEAHHTQVGEVAQKKGQGAGQVEAFISNPFGFTKRLLGQKKSGNLMCTADEMNYHLRITFSDSARIL